MKKLLLRLLALVLVLFSMACLKAIGKICYGQSFPARVTQKASAGFVNAVNWLNKRRPYVQTLVRNTQWVVFGS